MTKLKKWFKEHKKAIKICFIINTITFIIGECFGIKKAEWMAETADEPTEYDLERIYVDPEYEKEES